jgi:hypothetical protein
MRIQGIQENLQGQDIISRQQQTSQDPTRSASAAVVHRADAHTQQVQEQAQEVPQQEEKTVKDDRRREPFVEIRKRKQQGKPGEPPANEPPPEAPRGHFDVTA